MDKSIIWELIFGGGLISVIVAVATLRSTTRKAKAEALKAEADAETVRIDNAEHATRILVDNIVKPLKEEFNETKKELARNTREMARLRKAIDAANNCEHRDHCPVLFRLRDQQKEHGGNRPASRKSGGQHNPGTAHDEDIPRPDVGGEPESEDGRPP